METVEKPEDISKIESGVELLGKYIEDQIYAYPKRSKQYQLLSTYYTDPDKERINPFQAKVERLSLMKRIKKLDQELQKAGFVSAEEFAVKTDAMVKAYRAANMSYAVAVQARRYKAVTPQNKTEKTLVMGAKMYEAYPKDVQLVRDNLKDVREIFIKNGFQSVLNAESFDELRK